MQAVRKVYLLCVFRIYIVWGPMLLELKKNPGGGVGGCGVGGGREGGEGGNKIE